MKTAKKFDPYKTLGVKRSATADEIRAAYRAKAKAVHSDVGGDDSRMAEVNRANDILSDPAKRAAWDSTGNDDFDQQRHNIEQACVVIFGVVANEGESGNLIERCRKYVAGRVGQFERDRLAALAEEAKWKRLGKRVKRKLEAERDVLAEFIAEQIRTAKAQAEEAERAIREGREVIVMLGEWEDTGVPFSLPPRPGTARQAAVAELLFRP